MGWWNDLWARQQPGSVGASVGNWFQGNGSGGGQQQTTAIGSGIATGDPYWAKDYPDNYDIGVQNQPTSMEVRRAALTNPRHELPPGMASDRAENSYLAGLPPRIGIPAGLTLEGKRAEDARILRQQQESIASLEDIQSASTERYNDWLNDDQWATVVNTLEARSSDDYDVISDSEEAAQRLTLAQGFARESASADIARGASGSVAAGANAHQDASLSSYFSGAGLQVEAQRDSINTAARSGNLAALGQLKLAEQGVNDAYTSQQARLGGMIADVRLGVELTPTDFLEIAGLDFSMEAFDSALAQSSEFQAETLDQAKWNWTDGLDMLFRGVTAWLNGA